MNRTRHVKWLYLFVVFVALITVYLGYAVHTYRQGVQAGEGTLLQRQLDHAGKPRRYDVYLPPELSEAAPLVFVLHGSLGDGLGIRRMTGGEFDLLADQHGIMVVYPDGYESHWNDCRKSADYAANLEDIDDVGFIAAVIDQLDVEFGVDRGRVFATGVSNGGQLAYRLALEAPDLVAAIAPVAANLPTDSSMGCTPTGFPVSVAIFNGTEDPVNPYEGGTVSILGNESRGEVLSAQQTADYWRGLAQLSGDGVRVVHPERDGDPGTSVTELRWGSPLAGEVRLYTLHGSGHVMPSTSRAMPWGLAWLLGGNAGDISGSDEIINFFLSFIPGERGD